MKRTFATFICLILVFILTISVSTFADYNFTDMSEDELRDVAAAINDELINRFMVEQVEVPAGRYTVGVDIPAGDYTISIKSGKAYLTAWRVEYKNYDNGGFLFNMNFDAKDSEKQVIAKAVLEDGNIVDFNSTLVFETYHGLGFHVLEKQQAESENTPTPKPTSTPTPTPTSTPRPSSSSSSKSSSSSNSSSTSSSDLEKALEKSRALENTLQDAFDYIDSWGKK